ncbi:hypothetical protein A2U01_0076990, partial [Trifolium medium]|nr:hypothetical protein [Trifolium medium]
MCKKASEPVVVNLALQTDSRVITA